MSKKQDAAGRIAKKMNPHKPGSVAGLIWYVTWSEKIRRVIKREVNKERNKLFCQMFDVDPASTTGAGRDHNGQTSITVGKPAKKKGKK